MESKEPIGPKEGISPNTYESAEDLIKRADEKLWRELKVKGENDLRADPDVHIQLGFFKPKCWENGTVSPACCYGGTYCYVVVTGETELDRLKDEEGQDLAVLGHPYKDPEVVKGKKNGDKFKISE